MALFQKKPQVSSSAPLYTLGLQRTLLVVGLGNIGKEYDGTRHNVGFDSIDYFFSKQAHFSDWTTKKDLKCVLASGNLGDNRVIVIKPTTLMNNSGQAVRATCDFYKIPSQQVVVVHDELDISFGTIRTAFGGGSAGHNGISSIIEHLSADFNRIRVGIGSDHPARVDAANFVLAKFDEKETKQLGNLTKETSAILTEYIYGAGNISAETRSFIV